MAPRLFKDMPSDLKSLILSFIDRPTDLKTLCLTCKEFQEIATPALYRSIHLFVGGPQDLRLSAFLGRDNPGILHIREMFLRLEKMVLQDKHRHYHSDDSSEEEELEENTAIPARQAQFTVRLLLDFLPSHQLTSFSWQNWEPLSVENFMLLCKKQRSLRVLEIGPMDKSLAPVLEKHPDIFETMTEVDSIDIYPDTIDRLIASQRLLQAKPDISYLCVSAGFEYSNEEPEDLHDSSTRPGLLTRTLFSHMLPFEDCKPLALKALDLDTIELRYATDTWLKLVGFSCLVKLEIRNCAGAEVVFAALSKPYLRPTKLRSLRWMDDDKSEPHALEAFEGFLEALSGLETIHLFVRNMRTLPKVGTITKHKKTLTSLSLHSELSRDSRDAHTYSEDDYKSICTECSEIRQLSIMFPKTAVEHPFPGPEFSTFLTHTHKLQNLTTLNIRRWPSTRECFIGPYSKMAPTLRLYEHQLQRLTQNIFVHSDLEAKEKGYGLGHRSTLSVISWGGNGKTRHDNSERFKLKQIPFVRGLKVDPFGHQSLLAVQTIWRMVQFVEPESDILNHSLYDMHEIHQGSGL